MTQNINGKDMIQNWDGKNVDKNVTQQAGIEMTNQEWQKHDSFSMLILFFQYVALCFEFEYIGQLRSVGLIDVSSYWQL